RTRRAQPCWVAACLFDLCDLGSEIREHHRAIWTGEESGKVKNGVSVKCLSHFVVKAGRCEKLIPTNRTPRQREAATPAMLRSIPLADRVPRFRSANAFRTRFHAIGPFLLRLRR